MVLKSEGIKEFIFLMVFYQMKTEICKNEKRSKTHEPNWTHKVKYLLQIQRIL